MQEEGELSIDSILNDEPVPVADAAPVAEPAAETQPEGEAEQPRGPDGKFLPKQAGVDDTGPPPDQLPKEEYKAIREEREKRQALERNLEALQQQIQQLQQPQAPPAPPPSIWENEDDRLAHERNLTLAQANQLSRINASEMAARSQFADFQDKFDLFNTMAQQNPSVVQQAMSDPHPWRKAYEIAQSHQTMQELGAVNVADLEAKIEARLREEMQGSTPVPQPTLPPTLTTERNVGARSGPAWSGPPSIEEMLR